MDVLIVHFEVCAQQRVHTSLYTSLELFLIIAFCGTVYSVDCRLYTTIVSTNESILTYQHSFVWQRRRYMFRPLQSHHQANLQKCALNH
jgi:hypothetical protein